MEEKQSKSKLTHIGKFLVKALTALTSTIVSAVVVVILYVLYIPFAIGRALFNRKAVVGFYSDVFYALDGFSQRMKKREEVEND